MPQKNIDQAVEHTRELETFLSARPDVFSAEVATIDRGAKQRIEGAGTAIFSAEVMCQLCMLRRQLDKILLTSKKQVYIRSLI